MRAKIYKYSVSGFRRRVDRMEDEDVIGKRVSDRRNSLVRAQDPGSAKGDLTQIQQLSV